MILELFLLNLVFLALLWILGFSVLSLTYTRSMGKGIIIHSISWISHISDSVSLCPLPYRLELDGFAALWRIQMPLQVIIQFTFPSKIITYGKCLENSIYIELWRLFNKHQRHIFILTLLSPILLIFQAKLTHWYGIRSNRSFFLSCN